ncbi:cell differentiation and development protein Fsr1 [Aspergillus niger CBS 101883]|uniref:Striatin Pro11 n=3 Tax=Aspergillus TaxID=5052 RepID=A0A370P8A3_ASPPH|nr:striatin Pro11 [Aspergillus niger CBS 513.88]XP_025452505.1 striatin Pro11 [Aspergillus niger CBS 101883]PYH54450.1 striatin Pro11 [Aspergillus niger CBS 101883]RDH18219.1 striatin Pro11 [Aspergillus niger ATCC 13496]RDK38407.1 striatin Pro11 [Aspergillus phoenicis ATCC 13157]|eukprot:XP_001397465.2 striatin Pro11 [Aspergillus niger CBS 513.88]
MAWQSPSAMAGGGGYVGPGGDGSSNGGHPQGTEYTLQGVMRFLQTEWHRHERDRNAWEIERAEMKSRIGKLEGDVRTSKRLHESLGKHVRLLEAALKKEREKVKKLSNNEKVEDTRDPKEIAKESINSLKAQRPKPHTGPSEADVNLENEHEYRQENEREKSRLYLSKCSQEVAYHVIPSSHPPPELGEQDLPNHIYGNQQLSQQSLEEAYLQQQRQKQHQQQQAQANDMMAREVALQNHQPVITHYADNSAMSRAQNQFGFPPATREAMERRPLEPQQTPLTAIDNRKQTLGNSLMDERAGQGDQAYDGYGSQSAAKDTKQQRMEEQGDDADGWNFDEPAEPAPQAEQVPPHRPDVDAFPNANFVSSKSPQRSGSLSHRRKSSGARRKSDGAVDLAAAGPKPDPTFKVRFALRGHLDVVRSVIFTGGGSPSEPEICTCSDDGTIKRWIIPATYGTFGASSSDLDITSYFTHRGHVGAVTALAACSPQNFSNGGRALGDGWVFSGGQDTSVRVWERGRVDPKATLDGHTDAVWGLCVLPGTAGSVLGDSSSHYGGPDRILLASGGADGRIIIWAVSAPPQLSSPQAGSRRAGGSRRANSISSGSNFPSSPQPSTATTTPFHYSMVRQIVRTESPSPTCISPLSLAGINFVVSYTDASILVYDTRTGEEIVGMASLETYDGTPSTGVNSVVATTVGFDGSAGLDPSRTMGEEEVVHGATGSSGVEGVIISGYEDRYIRFFDANSGQCTYTMLAHPSAIASLSLSPDGRELVSAGHDASLRFWNLEKRSCTQEITSHRLMRGEGVCAAVWSRDGRWVVSGGGDGVVKVFSR